MSGIKYNNSQKTSVVGWGTDFSAPINVEVHDPKNYKGVVVYGSDGNLYYSDGTQWKTTTEDLIKKPRALEPTTPLEQSQLRLSNFASAAGSGLTQAGVIFELYDSDASFVMNSKVQSAVWDGDTTTATITLVYNHNLNPGDTYYADINSIRSSENTSGNLDLGFNVNNVQVTIVGTKELTYNLQDDPGTFLTSGRAKAKLLPRNRFTIKNDYPNPGENSVTYYPDTVVIGSYISPSTYDLTLAFFSTSPTRANYGAGTKFSWRAKYLSQGQESGWSDIFEQTFPKIMEKPIIRVNSNFPNDALIDTYFDAINSVKRKRIQVGNFKTAFSDRVNPDSTIWEIRQRNTTNPWTQVTLAYDLSSPTYQYFDIMDPSYNLNEGQAYEVRVKYKATDSTSPSTEFFSEYSDVKYFTKPAASKIKFVYDTTKIPSALNNTVHLSLQKASTETLITVYWGDGATNTFTDSGFNIVSHQYTEPGTYTVTIEGQLASIGKDPTDLTLVSTQNWYKSNVAIIGISRFGDDQVNLENMHYALANTKNLKLSGIDSINASLPTCVKNASYMFQGSGIDDLPQSWSSCTVNITNFSYMFKDATSFVGTNLKYWALSNGTEDINMSHMFDGCLMFNGSLNTVANDSSWITTKVTDMSYMFLNCKVFNQQLNLWNTSNVTNMSHMFDGCSKFNQVVSTWNTSKVTDMSYMFAGCTSYGQDIIPATASTWNTSKVTNMSYMFCGAKFGSNTNSIGTYAWDISKVTNMDSMFAGCVFVPTSYIKFKNVLNDSTSLSCQFMFAKSPSTADIAGPNYVTFDLSSATNNPLYLDSMFEGRSTNFSIQFLNATSFSGTVTTSRMFYSCSSFNQAATAATVGLNIPGSLTDVTDMFYNCTALNQPIGYNAAWKTASLTNLSKLFQNCSAFNSTISMTDTSNVTNMSYMFDGCSSFNKSLNFDTSNVTNMSYMFRGCSLFNQSLSGLTTLNVTNMSYMLAGCSSFNQSLSGLTTSNVTNMSYMLAGCSSFNQNLFSSVSKVTNFNFMFYNCSNFVSNTYLNSWSLNSQQFISAVGMFRGCSKFNSTVGNWDTSKINNMACMFQDCSAFNQQLVWNTSAVTDMSWMFAGCNVFDQNVATQSGNWNTGSVVYMTGMFYRAKLFKNSGNVPGIAGWNVGNVTNMDYMFAGASAFNRDLSFTIPPNKISSAKYMLAGTAAFNNPLWLHTSSWNPTNSNIDLSYMFGLDRGVSVNSIGSSTPIAAISYADLGIGSQSSTNYSKFNHFTVSSWKTTKVSNLAGMFEGNRDFNRSINGWDVSNVTNFSSMFKQYFASVFNQPLSSWSTSKATDMSSMFQGSVFNQSLSSWNVSKVSNFSGMFKNNKVFNSLLSWTTFGFESSVKSIDTTSMFEGAIAFNQDLSSWASYSSKIVVTDYMFKGAGSTNTSISAFDKSLGSWDISNLISAVDMFKWSALSNTNYSLTMSGWVKSGVTSKTDVSLGFVSGAGNVLKTAQSTSTYPGSSYSGKAAVNYLRTNKNWTIYDSTPTT